MNVGWTVRNVGRADAAGLWTDAVYLSSDAALGDDDIRLGSVGSHRSARPAGHLHRSTHRDAERHCRRAITT